ncbi:hypothetical protein [Streptomyces subrutilus]|uniref:hypothetical protein n=1 Tax=Streptomyces subrutilus TaxID=36818 RepID=UPI0033D66797
MADVLNDRGSREPRARSVVTRDRAAARRGPYGDLHHYAHSAHPVRWNHLLALEAHVAPPHFTPDGLLTGAATIARRHRQALNPPAEVTRSATLRTAQRRPEHQL